MLKIYKVDCNIKKVLHIYQTNKTSSRKHTHTSHYETIT
jgi:hypothetical protein